MAHPLKTFSGCHSISGSFQRKHVGGHESMWKKPRWSTVSSKATEVLCEDRRELKKPHKRGTPPFLACLSTRLHFLYSIAGPSHAVKPHEASGRNKATALSELLKRKARKEMPATTYSTTGQPILGALCNGKQSA